MSRDPQKTKNRILKEFNALYDSNGYDKTTMAVLSKACGMSLGNINFYFKKKEDLVVASFMDRTKLIFRILNEIAVLPNDILFKYLLRVIIFDYLASKDESLYHLMAETPEILAVVDRLNEDSYITFVRAFRQLRIPISEQQILTGCLGAVCTHIMLMRRSYINHLPLNYYHLYDAYCDMLFSQCNFSEVKEYRHRVLEFFEELDKDKFVEKYTKAYAELY